MELKLQSGNLRAQRIALKEDNHLTSIVEKVK